MTINKTLDKQKSLVMKQASEAQMTRTRNNWTLQTEQRDKHHVNMVKASGYNYEDELEGLRQRRASSQN